MTSKWVAPTKAATKPKILEDQKFLASFGKSISHINWDPYMCKICHCCDCPSYKVLSDYFSEFMCAEEENQHQVKFSDNMYNTETQHWRPASLLQHCCHFWNRGALVQCTVHHLISGLFTWSQEKRVTWKKPVSEETWICEDCSEYYPDDECNLKEEEERVLRKTWFRKKMWLTHWPRLAGLQIRWLKRTWPQTPAAR